MSRRTSRSRPHTIEDGRIREVAVLADGPWAPRRYWRDDLEAMQHASRAMGYPDGHPAAVLRGYHPTDAHSPDGGPGSDRPARLWRYQPATDTTRGPLTVPAQRGHTDAPDTTGRTARDRVERERLHRAWTTDHPADQLTDQHSDHDDVQHADHGRSLW